MKTWQEKLNRLAGFPLNDFTQYITHTNAKKLLVETISEVIESSKILNEDELKKKYL